MTLGLAAHESMIRRLYVDEGKSVPEIAEYLANTYDIHPRYVPSHPDHCRLAELTRK